jgi:hypothetical protein
VNAASSRDCGSLAPAEIPAAPTAKHALAVVAQLGGHLKRNGPPGCQVLGRGLEALLLIELGWRGRDRLATG